jgi:hypothetical protein
MQERFIWPKASHLQSRWFKQSPWSLVTHFLRQESLCTERHCTSQLCTPTGTASLDSLKCRSPLDDTTHHAPLPDQYVGQQPPSSSFTMKTEIAMYAEKMEKLQYTKRLNRESKKIVISFRQRKRD